MAFASRNLESPAPLDPGHNVRMFADALEADAEKKGFRRHFEKHEDWPLVAGILLELERRGHRACVTRPELEVLFTPAHICAISEYPSFIFVEDTACHDPCLAKASGRGLRLFLLKPLDLGLKAPEDSFFMGAQGKALFQGWSEPDQGVRWSLGKMASLVVLIADPSRFQGTLDLIGRSHGPQRIGISWNGHAIFDQRMQLASEGLKVRFPKEWIQSGYNVLSFDLPDAKMPGNGDLRVLALRLKDIRVQ